MVLDFFSGKDQTSVEEALSGIEAEEPKLDTEEKTQKKPKTTVSYVGQRVKVRSGYRIYEGLTGVVVAEPRAGRCDVKLNKTSALQSKTIRMDPKDFTIMSRSKESEKSDKDRAKKDEGEMRIIDEWKGDAKGETSTVDIESSSKS